MNFDVSKLPEVLRFRVINLALEQTQIASPSGSIVETLLHGGRADALEKVERIRKERDAILELTVGAKEPVRVKATPCNYCAKCREDFEPKQFVHYIKIDNDCVCTTCSPTISAEKEPRVYDPDAGYVGI